MTDLKYKKRELLPNGLILAVATTDDVLRYSQPGTALELRLIELLREAQARVLELEDVESDREDLKTQVAAHEVKQGELEEQVSDLEADLTEEERKSTALQRELDDVIAKLQKINELSTTKE